MNFSLSANMSGFCSDSHKYCHYSSYYVIGSFIYEVVMCIGLASHETIQHHHYSII